jgi:hypothetical protein
VPRKPRPTIDRFWDKVDRDGPVPEYRPDLGACWIWTGTTNGTYATLMVKSEVPGGGWLTRLAHRWIYEHENGPIPDGLVVNHLCIVPLCVRPSHLDACTPRENTRYGDGQAARKARQTECHRGHPLDHVNPDGTRRCTICPRERMRAKRARFAEQGLTAHGRAPVRETRSPASAP